MKRSITRTLALTLILIIGFAAVAEAQTAGRRPVRRASGVTGVELGLEGSLTVPRGGQLRWILSAYEVIGLQDLGPIEGATITLTTSLAPTEIAAEVTTDRYGRALLTLDVPEDAPASFRAVLRLRSASEIQRRFEMTVQTSEPRALVLTAARRTVQPRGTLRVLGRLYDRVSGRPLPQERVTLTLRGEGNRQLRTPISVASDRSGLFAASFRVPADSGAQVSVDARAGDDDHPLQSRVAVQVSEPRAEPMLLALAPSQVVVDSAQRLPIDVVLRTPNGRPIPGALVEIAGARPDHDQEMRGRTDERGRARLIWTAPRRTSGYGDTSVVVTARREGYGQVQQQTTVRVAATDFAASLAVEGGALVPSLGGRVWVRVVGIDGQPAEAGLPVVIRGPRIRGEQASSTTDDRGVATFDISLVANAGGGTDRCGGDNATALDVQVGPNPRRAASLQQCIPLDPDAVARVRLERPIALPGEEIRVEVERTAVARRLPVSVALLAQQGNTLSAVAADMLDGDEDSLVITLPESLSGAVIVRARPLYGSERQEVRGGSAMLWVAPGATIDTSLEIADDAESARLAFQGSAEGDRSVYVIGLPLDEARDLEARLRRNIQGPLTQLRMPPEQASEALLFAALAAALPRDSGAPAVLRGRNELVPVPAPENPVALGLLRDPWRSRARFITGRLALVFNAVEDEVTRALPERIDDVAVSERGRWRFNSEIIEAIASSSSLGGSTVAGLGGEPLTIEALQAFDRNFNYDNVARRITRERLFRLILALRSFVQSNGFDLPWSRRGDPSEWLRSLPGRHIPGSGSLSRQDLVDGWGRPFVLRRAPGGRTRFTFVDPLGNWEILSPGPDGRVGNGDDLWDPTARVLPSGSAYAEAVGEDVLVARLQGVELGRATVSMLSSSVGIFRRGVGGIPSRPESATEALAQRLWGGLPTIIEADDDALALRRPSMPGDGALGRIITLPQEGDSFALDFDEEPRTWGVVALAVTRQGYPVVALDASTAGAPILVENPLPSRIRAGEDLSVELHLTNLRTEALQISPTVRADGPIEVQPPEALTLHGESSAHTTVHLRGREPGQSQVTLELTDPQGATLREMHFEVRVETAQMPIRLRIGGALADPETSWSNELDLESDAVDPVGRVVLLTPAGLSGDPDLADVRRRDPALIAWADTMNGRQLSESQRAALSFAQTPDGLINGEEQALSTACAIIAWSAAGADDEEAMASLARARRALPRARPFADADSAAGGYRTGATVLAALAAGGVPEVASLREGALDPVLRHAAQLRASLRRAIHLYPEEPTILARAAAALLLADPRDGHGRAMAERAIASLEAPEATSLLLRGTENRPGRTESLSATLALAIAAHQLGRHELALRLLRGALSAENVLTRAGGEATFWMLAAGAYGAMGTGSPERVTVDADGELQTVDLSSGRAIVALDDLNPGRNVDVSVERIGGPALLVRAEIVSGRPFSSLERGPLHLELQGDVGRWGELAALELTVTAESAVDHPVIELQLPSGLDSEEVAQAITRSASVLRAQPRRPGFLRLQLAPMTEGSNAVISLPLRWSVRGELQGLGAIAYPASHPASMTVLAPRPLDIE